MGQQLALIGELGRLYPSERPMASSFAKTKGGNIGTQKQKQAKGNESKERELT